MSSESARWSFPTDDGIRSILASRERHVISDDGLHPAGVLLLLEGQGQEQRLIFNLRTSRVEHHKGEVSFPGGAQDPGDETVERTALREAQEEIGVRAGDVDVLGQLDDTFTRASGFRITPVVGRLPAGYSFRRNEREVEEIFSVPIAHLLAREISPQEAPRLIGRPMTGPCWLYEGHLIWGVTARIVKQLLDVAYR